MSKRETSQPVTAERAITDLGGLEGGPIDRHEHEPTLTERRVDAMMMLMRAKPRAFWGSDENRRTIESLTPEFYEGSGYYERWVMAMRSLLIEKGKLSTEEIDAKLEEVRARHGAKADGGGA